MAASRPSRYSSEPALLMASFAQQKASSQVVVLQVLAEANAERSNAAEWSGPQLALRCQQLSGKPCKRQAVTYCLQYTLKPKGLVKSWKEGHLLLLWALTDEARACAGLGLSVSLTHHAGPPRGRGAGFGSRRGPGAHCARAKESAAGRCVAQRAAVHVRALWPPDGARAALPRRDVRAGRRFTHLCRCSVSCADAGAGGLGVR